MISGQQLMAMEEEEEEVVEKVEVRRPGDGHIFGNAAIATTCWASSGELIEL